MAEWCFKTILLMIYLWKYFIVYIIQHLSKPFYSRKASIRDVISVSPTRIYRTVCTSTVSSTPVVHFKGRKYSEYCTNSVLCNVYWYCKKKQSCTLYWVPGTCMCSRLDAVLLCVLRVLVLVTSTRYNCTLQ